MSYVKRFEDIISYSDPESNNQECRDILPKEIVDGILIGFNRIIGPGNNGMGNHKNFTQVFVVIQGRGILHLGDLRILLSGEMIVEIPQGTDHDVFVDDGDIIEYMYVNKYREAH